MKNYFLFLSMFVITSSIFAQDEEMRYLFSNKDYRVSGFGAPIVQFTSVNGEFGVMNGGGGAVIFNNQFYIGGFGMGLSTELNYPDSYNEEGGLRFENQRLSMGYGGLWLGFIFMPNNPIHFGFSTKIGAGGLSLYDNDFESVDYEYHTDVIGVASPQVELEMNLTRWFKINFGVGYQFTFGADDETYLNSDLQEVRYWEDSDFSSPYGNITFLFGGFGPKKK